MSFKAKDLTYDATQPAFLRRLRGEMAGDDSARHERPIPRSKRLKQDDEEDAPTYVLEESNQSLSKAEYEALVSGADSRKDEATEDDSQDLANSAENPLKQEHKNNFSDIAKGLKKRKAVKIISADEEGEKTEETKASNPPKKPKKKAKAVKLSFGDEEG